MDVHIVSDRNSILNTYLLEIRDEEIQKDRMRFRKNIERITQLLCFEMSKRLDYETKGVKTGLGDLTLSVPVQDLVLCSILRAGLSMHYTILDCFDQADNAFISAFSWSGHHNYKQPGSS